MLLGYVRVLLLTNLGQPFDSLGGRAYDITLIKVSSGKTLFFPPNCCFSSTSVPSTSTERKVSIFGGLVLERV